MAVALGFMAYASMADGTCVVEVSGVADCWKSDSAVVCSFSLPAKAICPAADTIARSFPSFPSVSATSINVAVNREFDA